MQIIENIKLKEKLYVEKLENGLTIMILPRKTTQKKYAMWGVNFGSIDNHFINPDNNKEIKIPDGVAHFLEHKMFEQENGVNSLDALSSLGVDANAYTTNDYTTYLFECTDNFYEALDELMDYVQHPYFTDENVEKEKGIIGQEIMMYDDYPEWRVYLNALEAMYHEHPVKLDITGTIETISHIDKEILYKCYNTFYNPANMTMVVCGDFEPQELLEEIKKRLVKKEPKGEIKRIYPEEPETIVKEKVEQKMDVSQPIYVIGIKDKLADTKERVRKHIAIEILLNMIIGKSSKLYKELYNEGIAYVLPSLDYEYSRGYAHVLISGQSTKPEEIYVRFKQTVENMKNTEWNDMEFNRIKKRIYGEYVKEYNDVADISRMFLADSFKGINSFDYLEEISTLNKGYVLQVLKDVFKEQKMIISVIKNT